MAAVVQNAHARFITVCGVESGAGSHRLGVDCEVSLVALGKWHSSVAPFARLQCAKLQGHKNYTTSHPVRFATSAGEATSAVEVPLESEAGVSYEALKNHLAAGEWEEADNETRRLLCVLAGEGAAKRKWVYFTEVQFIPSNDFLTIDSLWRAYSNDRFGYSIQRRMWKSMDRKWKPFFLKIEWTYGRNSTYKKFPMDFTWDINAPVGHLPLTNALRGTQLLEKIFTHPAFSSFDAGDVLPDDDDLPTFTGETGDSSASSGPSSTSTVGSQFDEDFSSADYGF
eukprot:TRINITY_DN419_c0_g1_i2.p1 TRINITY_DN419_c0_g1~~TRINITY_DN419_c0_g1_i2.p1  ORF type:complete len:283 (+),score=45.85 TRINITY_DN419_c0_g1_i2:83-931(+)